MSKNTEVYFTHPDSVNPVLLKALGSLDLQETAELARYRRLRGVKQVALAKSYLPQDLLPANTLSTSLIYPPRRGANSSSPDDYLESSARLLETSGVDETLIPASDTLLPGGLTPLSITSMLMFLVTSALVGSAFMSPWVLEQLAFNQNQPNTLTTTPGELEKRPPIGYPFAQQPLASLARDEFVDLDLASLATLQPSPGSSTLGDKLTPATSSLKFNQAKPTPSPPVDPVGAANLTDALLPPSIRDNFYYVLTFYTGSRSLESAKAIVPDAYIRQLATEKWIQMGAFKTRDDAALFVASLKEKGIFASVYP